VAVTGDLLGIMSTFEDAISSFAYGVSSSENLSWTLVTAVNGPFHLQETGAAYGTGFCTATECVQPQMPTDIVGW